MTQQGKTKKRLFPRQVIRQQRQCPTCGQWCRFSITTDGTGWERHSGECGHVVEYRIVGAPN